MKAIGLPAWPHFLAGGGGGVEGAGVVRDVRAGQGGGGGEKGGEQDSE